jgi:phage terminase small subunit
LYRSRTRPHHHDVAPDPDAAPVDLAELGPPAGLVAAERAYWDQFAPLLTGAQVLTPADRETLADYTRCCAAVDDRGRRLRTAFRKRTLDVSLVRLLDSQLRGWVDRKTKLAGELGLTAIARTRVAWSGHEQVLDVEKKPQSKLAQLQQQAASLRRPLRMP